MFSDASVSMKEIASVAVARGRLGSAVRIQLSSNTEAARMRRREALQVFPEPKMPCTHKVV